MVKEDIPALTRLHAELLIEFHQAWRATWRSEQDTSELARIAFFTVEHAAKLYRYTGDGEPIKLLRDKPAEERRALVLRASSFVSLTDELTRFHELCALDEIEDEDMLAVEGILMALDSAWEVLSWCRVFQLKLSLGELDRELLDEFVRAECEFEDLDEALRAEPEIVLPALEGLGGMRALIKTPIDAEAWWLGDGEAMLKNFEDRMELELFGRVLSAPAAEPARPRNVIPWRPAKAKGPTLAAASSGEPSVAELPGTSGVLLELRPQSARSYVARLRAEDTRAIPAWAPSVYLDLEVNGEVTASMRFDEARGEASVDAPATGQAGFLVLRGLPGGEDVALPWPN